MKYEKTGWNRPIEMCCEGRKGFMNSKFTASVQISELIVPIEVTL